MGYSNVTRITGLLATVSAVLLVYWVFIFSATEIFGFKVFAENMTQAFYMSIIGLIAILAGSLSLNVIANLSQIAQAIDQRDEKTSSNHKASWRNAVLLAMSFPLIFSLLYIGDWRSSAMKQSYLVATARTLVEQNKNIMNQLTGYEFSTSYIDRASRNIRVLSEIDENFPLIKLIVKDHIDSVPVLLEFERYNSATTSLDKTNYIYSTSKEERTYLNQVLENKKSDIRFSADDGHYELYYPVTLNGRHVALYFSNRNRYGKNGS